MGKPSKDYAVPLWEKANLTVYEAAAYSGIGADKLRELSDREDCEFVLWNGTKRLIKRKMAAEIKTLFIRNHIYLHTDSEKDVQVLRERFLEWKYRNACKLNGKY